MEILSKKRQAFEEMKGDYPETLYKYRKWTDKKHKRTITHRELFYSPPSWFLDPMDCMLVVRYDLLSKQEKLKWIEFKLKEEDQQLGRPRESRNYYRSKSRGVFKTSPLADNKRIRALQEQTTKDYDARTGVLCLTGNPNIDKMWNEYSDNGQGFCIGLNSALLFDYLGGGGEVFYVPELPQVMPEPTHSKDEQMIFQVFYKEDKWSYEEEYRTHTFRPEPMTKEDRIIKVHPEVFKHIILGVNMSDGDKTELIASLPVELKHLPIIQG